MPGLTLKRQIGQTVKIGDAVVRISGLGEKTVKLIIEAPRSVPIVRGESDGKAVQR